MKRHPFHTISPEWWVVIRRLGVIVVLGTSCLAVIIWSPQLESWREQWKVRWQENLRRPRVWNLQQLTSGFTSTQPSPEPEKVTITDALLLETAQELRTEHTLSLLNQNATLKRLARLLALEAEDSQDISVPTETSDIMKRLTPSPPKNIEVILLFAPKNVPGLDVRSQLASSSALLSKNTTEIGIATRSATIEEVPGVLSVITVASRFPSEPPTVKQSTSTARPTFTGQDLWAAVQNYRKAHSLPLFEQSNELCTVASIRVNELLQLGKLDNHDGFQKRANEFFERNTGWTSINENIAAGYETAVQTVEWGWDQSLGHQALIQSREYPKACAAANSGFSVLITGK